MKTRAQMTDEILALRRALEIVRENRDADILCAQAELAKVREERNAGIARMRTAINMLDAGHTKEQVRVWLEGYCDAAKEK